MSLLLGLCSEELFGTTDAFATAIADIFVCLSSSIICFCFGMKQKLFGVADAFAESIG